MTTPTKTKAVALPEKKRLFDLAGNHWEEHAKGLFSDAHLLHTGNVAVDVRSYRNAGHHRDALAMVSAMHGPFSVSMSLTADGARLMAAALQRAADRVDEVNAALAAEKVAAKAFASKAKAKDTQAVSP